MDGTMYKTIALILAGGLGHRMGTSIEIPKQFYKLTDKPLLIHTLEIFENHPQIEAICVVLLEGWEPYLRDCLDNFGIQKVRWIVAGGSMRQESVFNGLAALKDHCSPDDVVIVHDGVRPFIGADVITANIEAVKEFGSAMTSIRSSDSLLVSHDSTDSSEALDRDSIFLVQTPQSYRYGRGLDAYEEARRRGIENSINCCELFITLGQKVHLVPGLKTNTKLTTAEDIDFLHALHAIYRRDNGHDER
jgi:2-C-methyl-D-erythritol 4-phosphate cytidylyltransferase